MQLVEVLAKQGIKISRNYAAQIASDFRDSGKVFICGWIARRGKGRQKPIYMQGNNPDVPEPPAKDRKEIHADYRKAHRDEINFRSRVRRAKISRGITWATPALEPSVILKRTKK